MKAIPAKLTGRLVEEMDEIIKDGWYANRSEMIRSALRDMIKRTKIERLEKAIHEDVRWALNEEN